MNRLGEEEVWREPAFSFCAFCVRRPVPEYLPGDVHFSFPSGKDFICILEAWLSCLQNCTAAGFLDDFHGKTVIFHPDIHKGNFCLHGIASRNAEGFQDCKIIPAVTGGGILGHLDSGNPFLRPCQGNCLNIAHALVVAADTVFNQVFDQVSGEMQPIIEKRIFCISVADRVFPRYCSAM